MAVTEFFMKKKLALLNEAQLLLVKETVGTHNGIIICTVHSNKKVIKSQDDLYYIVAIISTFYVFTDNIGKMRN